MQSVKPTVRAIDEQKVVDYLCRMDEVISVGTNREKRRFIRSFIRKMEYDPEQKKITIFWYHDPLKKTPFGRIEMCGNANEPGLGHH